MAPPRETDRLAMHVEFALASWFCVLWRKVLAEFSWERDLQTCLCLPRSDPTAVFACICTFLLRYNFGDTFNVNSCNFIASSGQQKFLGKKTSADVIPQPFSTSQNLSTLDWDCEELGPQSPRPRSIVHILLVVREQLSRLLQPRLVATFSPVSFATQDLCNFVPNSFA